MLCCFIACFVRFINSELSYNKKQTAPFFVTQSVMIKSV